MVFRTFIIQVGTLVGTRFRRLYLCRYSAEVGSAVYTDKEATRRSGIRVQSLTEGEQENRSFETGRGLVTLRVSKRPCF